MIEFFALMKNFLSSQLFNLLISGIPVLVLWSRLLFCSCRWAVPSISCKFKEGHFPTMKRTAKLSWVWERTVHAVCGSFLWPYLTLPGNLLLVLSIHKKMETLVVILFSISFNRVYQDRLATMPGINHYMHCYLTNSIAWSWSSNWIHPNLLADSRQDQCSAIDAFLSHSGDWLA